jgi:hypothetical protein
MNVTSTKQLADLNWRLESLPSAPTDLEKRLDAILGTIRAEVLRAARKHPPMHSAHEGYAILQEEVDELWEHVKADTGYSAEAMTEASQVAAMGIRYMLDLGGRE